jgi:hypothetical protein
MIAGDCRLEPKGGCHGRVFRGSSRFVASFMIHMGLPWHKSDNRKARSEDQAMGNAPVVHSPAGRLPDALFADDFLD